MNGIRPTVVVVAEAAPMRGGIATFAETITSDALLAQYFDMELLNTARTDTREGGKLNLDNLTHAFTDAWKVLRAARRADVVHLQLVADRGLSSVRAAALITAAALGGAKLVAHVHSAVGNAGRPEFADYGFLDRFALRSLRWADAVCTVSEAGAATMRRFAGRVPVETVDNAVDLEAFATPADHGVPTVLFVGVICRRKGTVELARAGRALRAKGVVDWKLVAVGGQGPTPEDEYREIVEEFRAADLAASLVGPEYGDQVKARLAEADIFVLPSYLEGQPIAILEAMASGLPVVGTAVGAVPDVIRDGVEGRIVEPGDVSGLAAAMEQLILDRQIRGRMAAASRKRAEEFHSLDRLARRLVQVYSNVLDGQALRSGAPGKGPGS
ncbi:glycosyltransferase family 4 protein [Kocuria flava]|uniref:glycosyltransferase family 4 protein n=1 Tax=Kocuria flava TaxID=446860 RepID=UPI001FF2C475|nr:glycosyltransferase family 4 protein [Kocuria flava]MCJ8505906.1 glycosyltransferase family 4 protein [Kocuria flava]